jgi:hypothetical protein
MAGRAGGGAYEGAFEAVGALLISMLAGYWIDQRYESEPIGLLVGAAFGFAAFVLRLVRLGRKLQGDLETGDAGRGPGSAGTGGQAGAKSDHAVSGNEQEERGIES